MLKGARVFFAWPIVTDHKDSKCYQSNQSVELRKYAEKIRTAVGQCGYHFLGYFEDSHFPSKCFLDSYAHLTSICAHEKTEKLIKELSKSPKFSNTSYAIHNFDDYILDKLSSIKTMLYIKIRRYQDPGW